MVFLRREHQEVSDEEKKEPQEAGACECADKQEWAGAARRASEGRCIGTETMGADDASFVLGDAFAAIESLAVGAACNGFPIAMKVASLLDECVHVKSRTVGSTSRAGEEVSLMMPCLCATCGCRTEKRWVACRVREISRSAIIWTPV